MSQMAKVVNKAIEAKACREYFHNEGTWEAEQRNAFAALRNRMRSGVSSEDATLKQDAIERLRILSATYKTRFPVGKRDAFIGILLKCLGERGWLEGDPPVLFGAREEDAAVVAQTIPDTLAPIFETVHRRDYSLLTKFLHFTYPNTFPIYDSQAAVSIRMWSYFEFRTAADWDRYSWEWLSHTSGRGYGSVVDFYVRFWKETKNAQDELQRKVTEMRDLVYGAEVSMLDVLDKLLWKACGNPVRLGLLEDKRSE